jgi:hypothetical protein
MVQNHLTNCLYYSGQGDKRRKREDPVLTVLMYAVIEIMALKEGREWNEHI